MPQVDNDDLNRVYAPFYAKQLKTEVDDSQVYFKLIRYKILTRAHHIYFSDRKLKDEGLVHLKFRLNKDGVVKRIDVIDQDSIKNSALREVAVEAIRISSPFPAFYRTMIKYDAFDVTINIDFDPKGKSLRKK